MKNQTFRMTMLFDFYGELLTDRQKEFYDLYYNEDLSLSEIAENYGISRQGVRDVIVRAENYMTEIEDKTGLIKRFMQLQPHVEKITDAAEQIKQLNFRRYEDRQLEDANPAIPASSRGSPNVVSASMAMRWVWSMAIVQGEALAAVAIRISLPMRSGSMTAHSIA